MHLKKSITVLLTLALPMLFGNVTYFKSAGAHPGATGAPGDGSCADVGCHTGNVVLNDTKVNSLIFPTADSTYIPGKTYLVKIKVNNAGIKRFGFEVGSLFETTDRNAGMLKVSEPSRTQLLTHKVNHETRYEITHTQDGNAPVTTGFMEWTFTWVAPATNQGNVIFYYATNSANNNAENTGDNICISTFKLKPAKAGGIESFANSSEFSTYYNQQEQMLSVKYNLKQEAIVKISVVDALGQLIHTNEGIHQSQGSHAEKIILPGTAAGIYYVTLHCGDYQLTRKVLLN